jgi:Tol biopolymer transport system component
MGISSGTRLGVYEVVDAIGAGGMGEVYRARDTKLGREVALKVLPEAFAADAERMGRFEREAKVLASLSHTNIAAIYGFQDSSGVHALAMELVEGPTLADLIAMGPLRPEDALPIAKQICEGLEYAHERGIVHRDLKPANVKVTPDSVVKLLDFGLAKALEGETAAGDVSSSPTMSRMATQAGVILGTAAYMSPEQAKGRPAGRRADVWAFGCVLFEMLTGKKPFDGETVTDILASVVKEDPNWSLLPSNTPPALQNLLHRCLKKDAKQRMQAIGDARIALEEILSGAAGGQEAPTVAPLAKRSRREIVAWVLVAVLALAAAGVAAWAWLSPRPATAPPAIAYIPPPTGASYRSFGFGAGPVVVSPDGKQLAFSATDEKGVTKIWVRPLAGGQAKPLAGTDDGSAPFWSADGHSLAFFAEEKLKTVSVENGTVQVLGNSTCDRAGAWSEQNVILFLPQCGGSIDKIPAAGGSAQPLIQPTNGETLGVGSFLPGGQAFLYASRAGNHPPSIRMASLSTGQSQIVLSNATWPQFASGNILFVRGDKVFAQGFDPSGGKLNGEAIPLAEAHSFSASDNGVLAFQGGTPDAHLEWFDRNGNSLGTIGDVQAWLAPKISRDGKQLLADDGKQDLWAYPVKGGVGTRLTFGPGYKDFSVWSPDGKYVAYTCQPDGKAAICRKPADGSGAEETILKLPPDIQNAAVVDWSPDGRYLSFDMQDPRNQIWGTWVVSLEGNQKPFQPAPVNANQYDGNFSPDGRWLAYFSYETGRPEVFVVPFPATGGKYQISESGGWIVRWAAGDKLFFATMGNRLMEADLAVSGKSLQVKSIEPLFQLSLPRTEAPLYDVTPDATRFIVATSADPAAANSITLLLNWPSLLNQR